MTVTKDQMARDIAEKSGYYLKDVKVVLSVMDDLVKEYFATVTDDNDVSVQIVEGIKISCKVVPERERVNPATGEPIPPERRSNPRPAERRGRPPAPGSCPALMYA